MTQYKAISDVTLPKIKEPLSSDAFYWQHALEPPKIVKEKGVIDGLDTNPFNMDLLVTSRDRISIYNINNMELKRTYQSVSSKKLDFLHSASYRRADFKMFTCSTDEGKVNIFDIDNSKPIRILGYNSPNAHTNAVRKCQFISFNQVISFSDDKHIKVWDISDGSLVQEIGTDATSNTTAHEDYIRAGCVFQQGKLIASGSYDHTVKIWDPRGPTNKPVNAFDFKDPVEALARRGTFLIASGSRNVKIFDLVANQLIHTLPNIHSKTITTLGSHGKFWFTGSLDGVVKIFDTYFSYVTSLSFVPSPLLSLVVNEKAFSVGATDGTIISRRFKSKENDEKMKEILSAHLVKKPQKTQRYFHWRNTEVEDFNLDKDIPMVDESTDNVFLRGVERKKITLPAYDKKLKKFHHSKALDLTLQRCTRKPELVVSMMQELHRRGTLRNSLADRDEQGFRSIASFLIKHLRDPRFSRILVDVGIIFCDIYRSSVQSSPAQQELFKTLKGVVEAEEKCLKLMLHLSGQIDMLLSNSLTD